MHHASPVFGLMRKSAYHHRKTWKDNYGEIPSGWHIHHIDGDATNNDPENLMCVSPEMHYLIHLVQFNKYGSYKDAVAVNYLRRYNTTKHKLRSKVVFTEERNKKISKSHTGEGNPMYGKMNGMQRKIMTPNGEYESMCKASKGEEIAIGTLQWRLKSKNFPEWEYLN